MSCPKNKILNPKTNRCVNKDGVIGKSLNAKKHSSVFKTPLKSPKKCENSKVLNPKSNRCVKKDGVIGRSILKASIHNKKILKEKYGIRIPDGYYLSKFLGKGEYGNVYILCKNINNDCTRAIKIQNLVPGFLKEIKMHQKFEDVGLAPKIYEYGKYKNKSYIILERFDGTFEDILKVKQSDIVLNNIFNFIVDSYYVMKKNKLVHGDLHWKNIAYTSKKEKIQYFLNDFGFSTSMKKQDEDVNIMELLQLYRTIYLIKNQYNRNYMRNRLIDFILKETDFDILESNDINNKFLNLHKKYQHKYYNKSL